MIAVNIKESIITHCKDQISKYNFGNRKTFNGTKAQQFIGIVGQCVVLDLFNLPLIDGTTGFDGGEDLNFLDLKIDVKTMIRKTNVKPNYVTNFVPQQKEYDTDAYILTSCNTETKTITIVGWMDKVNFINKSLLYYKGEKRYRDDNTHFVLKNDLYEIKNNLLYDVFNIDELKRNLYIYKSIKAFK
tara:strand:+ start:1158 stop:1718 length:561 start_codon:yes stop_codon:yes gene_type:complete